MLYSADYLYVNAGTNVSVHFTLFVLLTDGTQQGGELLWPLVFGVMANVFGVIYNPLIRSLIILKVKLQLAVG